jgi:hypothetical protein
VPFLAGEKNRNDNFGSLQTRPFRQTSLKCLHGIIDLVTSKVVEAVARFEASATAKAKIQKPERERRI